MDERIKIGPGSREDVIVCSFAWGVMAALKADFCFIERSVWIRIWVCILIFQPAEGRFARDGVGALGGIKPGI